MLTQTAPGRVRRALESTVSKYGTPRTETSPRQGVRSCSGLLVFLFGVLCMIGLVMVLSASSVQSLRQYHSPWHFFERQSIWLLLGAGAFDLAHRVPMEKWRRLARPLMIATLLALVAVLVHGRTGGGASRWLGFSSIQLQPSELAKIAMVFFAADVLERREDKGSWLYRLGPVLTVMVFMAVLIMKQPDMGTTIVVSCIAFAMMFAAGAPVRALSVMAGVSGVAALGLSATSTYRWERLTSFLHPFQSASTTGYQSAQGLIALGGGHLFGGGLGQSPAAWGFLPNQYTDFIFAVIGQETGLIGTLVVMGLFVAFAVIGIRIACRASTRFDGLVAAGVTAWLVAQAVINIGAVVGVLPVTGVPLPFISYGGTSLVITMFATGLLFSVARRAEI